MDLIDPYNVEPEPELDSVPAENDGSAHDPSKAEEAIEKLQDDIDKVYNVIQDRFTNIWTSTSKSASELQEKYKLDEYKENLLNQLQETKSNTASHVKNIKLDDVKQELEVLSTQANHALDALDSKLEIVENAAGKYFNSFTSYLSNVISVTPEPEPQQDEEDKEQVLFSTSKLNNLNNYGTSRYEQDLLKLHTTKQYYLDSELDNEKEVANFQSDSKTSEISQLLEKYPALTTTMNELVPVEISYNLFWYRYFKQDGILKDLEQKRKALLEDDVSSSAKEDNNEEEDEDIDEFTWDDEDEQENIEETVPVTTTSTKKVKQEQEKGKAKAKEEQPEEEDDDDDWE
ncbi:hypothetical protein JA1_001485 [Spathaspora sp. JA1]|nr:hypothetical protein JA1_001485 [Spathaspora sp. JA1]